MRSRLVTIALIVETGVIVIAAYVFYRWKMAHAGPWNNYQDLVPFSANFEVVVAPWLFGAAFIPACLLVLGLAGKWFRQ